MNDLRPRETVWDSHWHCWHCRGALARLHDDNGALTLDMAAVCFAESNNRGLLMVQCAHCCRWSQWWQGAPHVQPEVPA